MVKGLKLEAMQIVFPKKSRVEIMAIHYCVAELVFFKVLSHTDTVHVAEDASESAFIPVAMQKTLLQYRLALARVHTALSSCLFVPGAILYLSRTVPSMCMSVCLCGRHAWRYPVPVLYRTIKDSWPWPQYSNRSECKIIT